MTVSEIVKLPAIEAAPLFLGCTINRQTPEGLISLKIVETEAYRDDDPASHSFRGVTPRTAPMFEEGGHIYVYFTYGMHYCVNIVVGQKGRGEAVLLRAGEPLTGIDMMRMHRGTDNIHNLTNGPAKLTQALGIISTELSGKKLGPNTLQLSMSDEVINNEKIITSPRIGIKQAIHNPWRFYIKDSKFVSRSKSV
jgi:DNA-3-methyladenine glycosylase